MEHNKQWLLCLNNIYRGSSSFREVFPEKRKGNIYYTTYTIVTKDCWVRFIWHWNKSGGFPHHWNCPLHQTKAPYTLPF